MGSSPLARGLLHGAQIDAGLPGIIPARAGFTRWRSRILSPVGDHPRSRGVYDRQSATGCQEQGSSPLARGLLGINELADDEAGIIPARAGFTTNCT